MRARIIFYQLPGAAGDDTGFFTRNLFDTNTIIVEAEYSMSAAAFHSFSSKGKLTAWV